MNTFRNTDTYRRVWPNISRPDGTTLELGPSEVAELDLPRSFANPHLEAWPRAVPKKLPTNVAGTGDGDSTTADKKESQS